MEHLVPRDAFALYVHGSHLPFIIAAGPAALVLGIRRREMQNGAFYQKRNSPGDWNLSNVAEARDYAGDFRLSLSFSLSLLPEKESGSATRFLARFYG